MSQILVNEVNFYYELFGEGEIPIVFIPGYSCDYTLWSEISAAFNSTHRILLFDNQGSGKTKDQGMPLTIWGMAENIYALIELLKFKKPIIVGYAMGGNIAQAIAILFSNKIRQLFLISTVHKWSNNACAFVDKLYRNRAISKRDINAALLYDTCYGEKYKSEHTLDEYQKMYVSRSFVQTLVDEKRQITALKQFDSSKLLNKIQAPTVVITPQEEKLATVEEGGVLAGQVGFNAKQVIINGCGHAALFEQPHEIIRILKDNIVK